MRENALFQQSHLKVSIAAEETRDKRPAEKRGLCGRRHGYRGDRTVFQGR